ncbi:related to SNU66-component of the U4/U6.U5 snRNP complex [Sporisorium scitamineum]|uniref:Related to SNU66-component of the U4/U6.U5 snRNP complex n=1 Tax=Sporisorium scitamineum TaxID=49012 RepID=A0A127ZC15_9BASI|nr:related to SNU66-component of the U4/U6.U5 snRNP complex [Sporisorium scitamineum]
MSEFQKEELSLEETNKLRISLGLKPLVADDAPAPAPAAAADAAPKLDGDALAAKNFQDKQERERREREDAEVKERLAKAQAKRDAARRLKGPTLADADQTGEASSSKDTLKWLKESKKRAKEHAARRAKEQEEQEAREQAQYRESDLAGLRVGHDADEFGEGEERILTLRDAGVLDDADDELMDAALDQAERDAKNTERKKGAKEYTGLDDEEARTGRKRGVLSKYDADLPEGHLGSTEEQSGFRLGANLSSADRQTRLRQEAEQAAKLANKQLLSLDYTKSQEVSDYLQEGDIGFKKPKTKKRKKATKVKISFDDDEKQAAEQGAATASASATADTEDVEMQETKVLAKPPRRQQTDNFVDDDELQASLAKSRRLKAKKTFNKMTPEMIAKNLAAQRAAEEAERASGVASPGIANGGGPANGSAEGEGGQEGLTFDETSEFVRAIRERPAESEVPRRSRSVKRESPDVDLNAAAHVKMEDSADAADVPMRELDATTVKTEVDDNDVDLQAVKDEPEEGEALDPAVKLEDKDDSKPEEQDTDPVIGRGMAGTLSFLRQQGMLPQVNPELKSREEQQRQYDAWLAARRREEQERELARQASKASGSSVDQATREAQNRNRELEEARLAQERFRDYKPDVEIKYHDEFGRDLDQKEAWKHLSHVFHGKKPGTKKQGKRLKKIEDEKKRERMAAGDTPTGMSAAFQSRSERTGKAHMVLSVGSRGAAPQENDLLDGKGAAGMQLKKSTRPAKEQSGKGKKVDSGGGEMLLSPLPNSVESSGAASVAANGEGTGIATSTKAGGGWTRIGSATPAPSGSGTPSVAAGGGGGAGFKPVAANGFTSVSAGSPAAAEAGEGRATPSSGPFRLAFSGVKRKAEGQ